MIQEMTRAKRDAAAHLLERRRQAVDVVPVVAARAAQQVLLVVVAPAHAAVVPGCEGPAHMLRHEQAFKQALFFEANQLQTASERTFVTAQD